MLYIKKISIIMMKWLGFIRLFQFINRNKIIILMIHGVMDINDNSLWVPLQLRLSREHLDLYLRELSKHYHFISLMDAVDMIAGRKPVKPYSVVLTFDDGYRNNITHALPILRRYGAPAAFFVSTGFLNNTKPFWFDRLDYALQHVQTDSCEVKLGSLKMNLNTQDRRIFQESYEQFRLMAKQQHMSDIDFQQEMERMASEFEKKSGRALKDILQNDDWSAIMTWEQIKQCTDDSITIGSHMVDHIRLEFIDSKTAYNQLSESKRDIENNLGKPCLSLAYPNGNFNNETTDIARQCGYVCGVTTEEGLNQVGDDPMKLRRISLSSVGIYMNILVQISGLSAAKDKLKKLLLKCKCVF